MSWRDSNDVKLILLPINLNLRNSTELSADCTNLKNRQMISHDDLVIKDTVFNWKTTQPAVQKNDKLVLTKEQLIKLSKIKEEIGKRIESCMKKAIAVFKLAAKYMLSEKPDMKLRKKYHNEMVNYINFIVMLLWLLQPILLHNQ